MADRQPKLRMPARLSVARRPNAAMNNAVPAACSSRTNEKARQITERISGRVHTEVVQRSRARRRCSLLSGDRERQIAWHHVPILAEDAPAHYILTRRQTRKRDRQLASGCAGQRSELLGRLTVLAQ